MKSEEEIIRKREVIEEKRERAMDCTPSGGDIGKLGAKIRIIDWILDNQDVEKKVKEGVELSKDNIDKIGLKVSKGNIEDARAYIELMKYDAERLEHLLEEIRDD